MLLSTPSTKLTSLKNRCEKKGTCMVCWEWEAKKWTLHDEDVGDNLASGPFVFVCHGQPEVCRETVVSVLIIA